MDFSIALSQCIDMYISKKPLCFSSLENCKKALKSREIYVLNEINGACIIDCKYP